MSRSGEINKLSKLIRPHIAIITNIGEAHIENFKNLKGIAKAKAKNLGAVRVRVARRRDGDVVCCPKRANLCNTFQVF